MALSKLFALFLPALVAEIVCSAARNDGTPTGQTPKTVYCRRKAYPTCYMIPHVCPNECKRNCKVDCVTCKPLCHCEKPGAVCDDPRFIGGDGVTFYFHGQKDRDFCLVSDTNLHINGHFIGKRGNRMNRDFTWVQSIAVMFDEHKLFIAAKKVGEWDDSVDQIMIGFDGKPIFLPTIEDAQWAPTAEAAGVLLTITRSGPTNEIVVEAANRFRITAKVVPIGKEESRIHGYGIGDDDSFAHLDLSFRFYSLSGNVNGVLGQTYAENYVSRAKLGVKMPVLGGDREFASSGLFATDCAASRFRVTPAKAALVGSVDHDQEMECTSRRNGRGIVCKK